jgi:hypothetical protein
MTLNPKLDLNIVYIGTVYLLRYVHVFKSSLGFSVRPDSTIVALVVVIYCEIIGFIIIIIITITYYLSINYNK